MTTPGIEGERLIFCGNCGKALPEGTTFCGACGTSTVAATVTSPPPMAVGVQVPFSTEVPSASADALIDDALVTVEAERQRRSKRLGVTIAVVVIALSLAGRYVYEVLTTEPDPGEVIAAFQVDEQGGRFRFDEVGEIRVPKGALNAPTTIEVRRSIPSQQVRVNAPNGGTAVLPAGSFPVYDFEPKSVRFLKPVMLILPAPPGTENGRIFTVANGKVRFFDGKYENGKVSMTVTSFDLGAEAA